ncbi:MULTISPECIES: NADPH-dependent oxidoreductase [unclassified Pseudomonas]|uniref:NADPH-dependent oxidoreductase n=1 Tax=unclassified Pseudomonas TaxID=196821 RepID=UPI000BD5FD08|nr:MULTISPECIES: NADPH-dependent oxidoreductase [unclassified Pseudomonas]PVZ19684.1 nitroreductase [Pseudomonas sp. URIL14HWK12:I12]PVZ22731.1 nitroreductase [Pseudomonas sp. URIL14HWK12:I10]PVZ37639.1 nitroreductase [Pseudomonas sp. URIL14HWK12:I11]SNZ15339.1 Nitroreductase [Pseudomonas sp. URIL14HWK12:I9]
MTATAQARLAARYGAADGPALEQWNQTLDQLLDHRSVRAFADTPLPPGTLESLIAAAQSASSSSNLQVWSVVAVEDAERKQRLSALAGNQAYIHQAPLFMVWLADLSRASRVAQQRGVALEALPYLESLLLGTIDAALAAQNAVVALESLGLGSVYIGAIRNDIEGVARELKLPPQVYPVFGLCVGHPSAQRPAKVKPRLPQRAVLHRETYCTTDEPEALAQYDERLGAFYQREGMKASGWSEQVVTRLQSVANLHGRERLVEQLKRLGFGLR